MRIARKYKKGRAAKKDDDQNNNNGSSKTASDVMSSFDQDLFLPDLPWEGDSVSDPSRGVAKISKKFDQQVLRDSFRVYREFVQQHVASINSMSGQVAEGNIEAYLREGVDKARRGDVGNLPAELEDVFNDVLKLLFEGHMLQVLSEFVSQRGPSRKPEVDSIRSQAEELMRKATAKCKLLGQDFVDFMQTVTAEEMENVKKSPYQRHAIVVKDKAHIGVIKPFTNWMASDLQPIVYTEFSDAQELERTHEIALKTLEGLRRTVPNTFSSDKIPPQMRDFLADAAFYWCKAALAFHCSKRFMELFFKFTDTRLRGRAEELAEDSIEIWSNCYRPNSTNCGLQIPVPHSDPLFIIDGDRDFVGGEDGQRCELNGDLDRAEEIYKAGVKYRWFNEFDETEYVYFMERRGRTSKAMEASDRSLEALNKKTHPSVYPFPTKAQQWLEGAPLSQETAEHLWLRNMGEVYFEHADFNARVGRYQTSREQRQRGIGFFKMALRLVHEKSLPASWRAPLFTQARMLCHSDVPLDKASEQVALVEKTIDDICALDPKLTAHWIDRRSMIHVNAALIFNALPIYHKVIMDEAQQLVGQTQMLTAQESLDEMKLKAQQNVHSDRMRRIIEAVDVTAGNFRRRMMSLRDREKTEGNDMWHVYNLLRFWVRVSPKTAAKVDELWKEFEPTFEYFYLQTALGNRARAKFMADVLRRMSFILLAPGATDEHKKLLLQKLTLIKERMRAAVQQPELDRAIQSLEMYFEMKQKLKQQQQHQQVGQGAVRNGLHQNLPPPYTFGDSSMVRMAQRSQTIYHNNPLLGVKLGNEEDYLILRERERQLRESNTGNHVPSATGVPQAASASASSINK